MVKQVDLEIYREKILDYEENRDSLVMFLEVLGYSAETFDKFGLKEDEIDIEEPDRNA